MESKLKSYTKEERLTLSAWVKLNRASEIIVRNDTIIMNKNGLTVSQFGVMETLYHKGPLCQKELADKLLRSGGNITKVIDNLERDGYVIRIRDERDRRYFRIKLTSKGTQKIKVVFPKVLDNLTQQFSILTEAEQFSLGELCKRLGTKKEKETR
jgi:MarR family 2-MHQ and catechol resistance regulon transcriptional repressor